jgi:peptidyl-prolyl cis-trans isomerase SurA
MIYRIASFTVCLLLLTSWNFNLKAQSDDPVLFTVNGKEVRVSEFTYIYDKTNGDKADYSEKSLQEYLDLYIDFKLQVAKGEDMGLDKNPKVLQEQNQYKRQLSSTYLTDREITEKLVKEAYENSKEDRKISHILVMVKENAPEDQVRAAMERIQKVKSQVTAENFGDLAKQYSDDGYSKKDGGNLGYFTIMQLPYELEKAMYNTKKGEVSGIVRTKYGFHILKVDEVRPAFGQVQLAQILIRPNKVGGEEKAKAIIDSLHKELTGGAKFSELTKKHSMDNASKSRAGIIGWVGINKFPADFEKEIFALKKDGELSKPIKTSAGWHILQRVKAMKDPSYQQVKGELTTQIKRDERFQIVQDSLVARIKREGGYKKDEKLAQDILAALEADKTFLQGRWNPSKDLLSNEKVLFSIGNINATVKEFVLLAQRSPNERFSMQPRTAQAAMERILAKLESQKALIYEETQLDKKYPEFKALMREYEEGILLFEVKKELVWDKASNDDEGLKAYYEEHKNDYQWKERAKVTFYTLRTTDKKLVKKIKKKSKKKTAEEVKELFNQDNAVVQTTQATYEKGKNSEVDALKWKAKTISKGYEKDGSFYFTKIEEVLSAENKTLDEARGYVVADYQDALEKSLIEDLRKKFKVEVNKEVFKSLQK